MKSHADFLDDLEADENGHFLIEEREGRAHLKVTPPGQRGRPVRFADVRARLELFRLEGYDRAEIEEIIAAADGDFYDICPWPERPSEDAELKVEIEPDGMTAHLELKPPRHGGRRVDAAMIHAALTAAGVTHGLHEDTIGALADGSYVDPAAAADHRRNPHIESTRPHPETDARDRRLRVEIAKGRRPRPGQAGRVRLYFEPRPRPAPGRPHTEEERVDFRKLNVIQTCQPEQLLAEIVPAREGEPGFNVRGDVLAPPPGQSAQIEAGKNTRLSEDGQQLFATLAGQVRAETMRSTRSSVTVAVEEVLQLEAVDYSTGHIDFPGTVQIEGTVLDGFEVKAGGDIIIQKTVGPVKLFAAGDIVLAGGAFCKNEGEIVAGQSIFARFVQDTRLYAVRDIVIEEAAMGSRLSAGHCVFLDGGGRGELIGGEVLAGREVRARKIGARSEALTRITVGIQPDAMRRIQAADRELLEKQTTLRKIETHLSQIDEAVSRGKTLSDGERTTVERLQGARKRYGELVAGLEKQRRLLYETLEPEPEASVEASEVLFPGVEVYFGTGPRRYRVEGRAILAYSRFVLEDGHILLKHSDL